MRIKRSESWRQRLLGHPRARLIIHRHHLVTLYPDGRMKITGPITSRPVKGLRR